MSDYITFKLSTGDTVIIDNEDQGVLAFTWVLRENHGNKYVGTNFYVEKGKRKSQYIHRMIYEKIINRHLDKNEFVDHKNLNPLDNRRENLRLSTNSQNQCNRGKPKNNTTGFKGVSRYRNGKYVGRIRINNTLIYLGSFDAPEDAHEAYKQASQKYHGEFGRTE